MKIEIERLQEFVASSIPTTVDDVLREEQRQEIDQLRAELADQLAKYNTSWQHDPPQVGDTRWEKCMWTEYGSVAWEDESMYGETVE